MNRKIAFRAWDNVNKIMINAIFVGLGKVYGMTKTFKPSKELEDVILMQYTGLKDKNGKEIFEGDIIEINIGLDLFNKNVVNPKKVVKFNEERARFEPFAFQQIDGSIKRTGYFGLEEYCEVLGNIYENPELLDNK